MFYFFVKEKRLIESFKTFDRDKSGQIDILEFNGACRALGLVEDDEGSFDALFNVIDVDGSMCLDYEEFKLAAEGKLVTFYLKSNVKTAANK